MKIGSFAFSKFALVTSLLVLPLHAALAQSALVNSDLDTAVPAPAVQPATVNSGMTSALQVSLSNLIAISEIEAGDMSITFDREIDINNGSAADSALDVADPNKDLYIQLTEKAGTELSAGKYSAAADDFGQADALYPGRTAAVLREAVAQALAGNEDKAESLAAKIEVVGNPALCQAAGKLEEEIEAAKSGDVEPAATPAPVEAPAPTPLIAAVPALPVATPDVSGPSAVDTLFWIVDKLNTQQNHFITASYVSRDAHVDDYKYGCVQTGLVEVHKNVWRLADSTPVVTTNTVNIDVNNIVSVKLDSITTGNLAGSSAITLETSGDDISLHQVIQDIGNPWNPRTNFDTTQQVNSYRVVVVQNAETAQRILNAFQHIVDLNTAAGRHGLF